MRRDIVHIGADELHYEICSIGQTALSFAEAGLDVYSENIGDPVIKGQEQPLWMKEIVGRAVRTDAVYGYSPTKGVLRTREFLAAKTNSRGGAQISPEDIIFFNGLGDAVSKVFGLLKRTARILVPSPGYMTYTSAEASHAGMQTVSYCLDPANGWLPDLDDLENRIRYNPSVAGILLINPDNPTGLVYPEEILRQMVGLARKYDLFIIVDETYENIVYNGKSSPLLCEVIGDVPAISMKSISKEMAWPGGRCGWIEVYNKTRDIRFDRYISSVLNAKMLEVCSSTLPQTVLPEIIGHPGYKSLVAERVRGYEAAARIAGELFNDTDGVFVNQSNGAFYTTVVFEEGRLAAGQRLVIENSEVGRRIEELAACPPAALDQRFTYYLLGATGICVVPLSVFNTELQGFRMTLLEKDEKRFTRTVQTIRDAINRYLSS